MECLICRLRLGGTVYVLEDLYGNKYATCLTNECRDAAKKFLGVYMLQLHEQPKAVQ